MEVTYQRCKELASEHNLPLSSMILYQEICTKFTRGQVVPQRTISDLAKETGMSRVTVRKYLGAMKSCGLIDDRDGYFVPVPEERLTLDNGLYDEYTQISYPISNIKYIKNNINYFDPTINYSDRTTNTPDQFFGYPNMNYVLSEPDQYFTRTVLSNSTVIVPTSPVPSRFVELYKNSEVLCSNAARQNTPLACEVTSQDLFYTETDRQQTKDTSPVDDPTFIGEIVINSSVDPDLPSGTILNADHTLDDPESVELPSPALSPQSDCFVRPEPSESVTEALEDSPPIPFYFGYTWEHLEQASKPLSRERKLRILDLGLDHIRARARYVRCVRELFPKYLAGDIADDPLDTLDYSPYASLGELLRAEEKPSEPVAHALSTIHPYAGRGKELVARWKARRNRSTTFEEFLEFVLMGDFSKPDDIYDPTYAHWYETFLARKRSL